jgi:hypothetical protein
MELEFCELTSLLARAKFFASKEIFACAGIIYSVPEYYRAADADMVFA